MKENILITGGSGFIGKILSLKLSKYYNLIIIDKKEPDKLLKKKVTYFKSDFSNLKTLKRIFRIYKIKDIIHLAAYIDARESRFEKKKYVSNNYKKFIFFLNFCKNQSINKIIFASTAAVYGNSNKVNSESSKAKPINNYGRSKFLAEKYLIKLNLKNKIILRFFNVVGAEKRNRLGPSKKSAKNLFRIISERILKNKKFYLFGKSFSTKDGTTIRDYIHVEDICDIITKLIKNSKKFNYKIINCGYEKGYSVSEVIKCFEEVTNKKLNIVIKKKIKGDIPYSVARCKKLNKVIEFNPKYKNLKKMIISTFNWEKKLLFN
tara:strand:- start:990 stop:1949 length:960 start_codon:yes stop_codon:yes gene_type:complete